MDGRSRASGCSCPLVGANSARTIAAHRLGDKLEHPLRHSYLFGASDYEHAGGYLHPRLSHGFSDRARRRQRAPVLAPRGSGCVLEELNRTIDSAGIDTLVVQFNYGFFNFNHFADFLSRQTSAGRKVVVMLHSTKDQAFRGDSKPLARTFTPEPSCQM